ncbi:hypothetical protein NPIL_102441 [Nephila pilipes]|uniref:Uncharacterized protein n=1 Tax=Nephila pilipes TaxID=299642 RepID=A0A8X6MQY1_NEPPI|nr:hypothetical protein NPIL_102441 [Nephila pilipes]
MLTSKEKTFPAELFYHNNSSVVPPLRKFLGQKNFKRKPMSYRRINKIVTRFDVIGRLVILLDRGQKQVDNSSVDDVATLIISY